MENLHTVVHAMMEKPVGIKTTQQSDIFSRLHQYFSNRPEVVAAVVFGSVARGDIRPHSDVNVVVLLTRGAAHRAIHAKTPPGHSISPHSPAHSSQQHGIHYTNLGFSTI